MSSFVFLDTTGKGGRVDYLNHVTLNTGHVRRSPRSEVSDEILVELVPALTRARARGRAKLPNFPGYFVSVDQEWTGGAAFTLSKRRLPLVRCVVATDTASAWQGPGLACGSRRGRRSTCGAPLAWGVAYAGYAGRAQGLRLARRCAAEYRVGDPRRCGPPMAPPNDSQGRASQVYGFRVLCFGEWGG